MKSSRSWVWREIPEKPPTPGESVPPVVLAVLVPVVAALIFWWLGRTSFALAVVGIGAAFLALRYWLPNAHRAFFVGLNWFGQKLGDFLGGLMLRLIFVSIFVPTALIRWILGGDRFGLKRPSETSTWRDVPPGASDALHRYQFLPEPAPTPRGANWVRRLITTAEVAAVLLVLNYCLGWVANWILVWFSSGPTTPYLRELNAGSMRYEPFVSWRQNDFAGTYINIRAGIRAGYVSPSGGKNPVVLHVFGGSTVWGVGASDEHTIPSELARLAEADQIDLRVVNYGECGYVVWQNTLDFAANLADGNVPDVAVFYNGFNETFVAVQAPHRSRTHMNLQKWEAMFDAANQPWGVREYLKSYEQYSLFHGVIRRLRRAFAKPADFEVPPEEIAHGAVETYSRNIDLTGKMATAYGCRPFFYWQPSLHTRTDPRPSAAKLDTSNMPALPRAVRSATDSARLVPNCTVITDIFDDTEQEVYIDFCHLNEAGNLVIAKRIYQDIRGALQAASRKKQGAK